MRGSGKNPNRERQGAARLSPPQPVYWESQKDMHCGRHALNMLFGNSTFAKDDIDHVAREVNKNCKLGAHTVTGFPGESAPDYTPCATGGNWDADVLLKAANSRPTASVSNFAQNEMPQGNTYQNTYIGSLIHEALHPHATHTECAAGHYTCLRKCENRLYHLDSLKPASAHNEISFSIAQRIISRPNVTCWHVFRNPLPPSNSQPVTISAEVSLKQEKKPKTPRREPHAPATVSFSSAPHLCASAAKVHEKQPITKQTIKNRPQQTPENKRNRTTKKRPQRPSQIRPESKFYETNAPRTQKRRKAIGRLSDDSDPGSRSCSPPGSKRPRTAKIPPNAPTTDPPPQSGFSGARARLFPVKQTTPSCNLAAKLQCPQLPENTCPPVAREQETKRTATIAEGAPCGDKSKKRQSQHGPTSNNTICPTRKTEMEKGEPAARRPNANKSSRMRNATGSYEKKKKNKRHYYWKNKRRTHWGQKTPNVARRKWFYASQ